MRWATRIEQALDEDRFIIYGQRIDTLSTGDAGAMKSVGAGLAVMMARHMACSRPPLPMSNTRITQFLSGISVGSVVGQ